MHKILFNPLQPRTFSYKKFYNFANDNALSHKEYEFDVFFNFFFNFFSENGWQHMLPLGYNVNKNNFLQRSKELLFQRISKTVTPKCKATSISTTTKLLFVINLEATNIQWCVTFFAFYRAPSTTFSASRIPRWQCY